MARRLLLSAGAAAVLIGLSAQARAHFVLVAPACYSEQSSLGLPLKSAPCGQADPGVPVVLTGEVTQLEAGSMVTITIDETIYHPGHYRVALAADQASLPADPPVTPGTTPCGTTVIDPNPTLPLLADGLLVHTAPFSGERSVQVQIPANMTCQNCVLQVVEFMSNHGLNNPGGCFYHHCAVVTIVPPVSPDAGVSEDAGLVDAGPTADVQPGPDAAPPASDATPAGTSDAGAPGDEPSEGCGCHTSPRFPRSGALGLGSLLLGLLARGACPRRSTDRRRPSGS
ncbi:MAG: lytic polysaccharide monooxygenase [Deltaproteobacteria bacterium]|nr:lytic polysaccharide monooxygenase [Deltaproteobacteria bacterium]